MLARRAGCAADGARGDAPDRGARWIRPARAGVRARAGSADARAAADRRPQRAARRVARAFARRARGPVLRRRGGPADPGARARGCVGGHRVLRWRSADRAAVRARAARAVRRPLAAAARHAREGPRRRARLARAGSGRAPRGGGARDSGILAESLVRRLPAIEKLRIASTGAFTETETARRDQRAAAEAAAVSGARRLPERWRFADPIGARALAPAASADLEGFAESHCVGALEYLEPPTRGLARGVAQLVAPGAGSGFAVARARDTRRRRGGRRSGAQCARSDRGRRRARRCPRCGHPRAQRARRAVGPARRARARSRVDGAREARREDSDRSLVRRDLADQVAQRRASRACACAASRTRGPCCRRCRCGTPRRAGANRA